MKHLKKTALAMMTVATVLISAVIAPVGASALTGEEINVVNFTTGNPAGG